VVVNGVDVMWMIEELDEEKRRRRRKLGVEVIS
jgi:hypothetical protein